MVETVITPVKDVNATLGSTGKDQKKVPSPGSNLRPRLRLGRQSDNLTIWFPSAVAKAMAGQDGWENRDQSFQPLDEASGTHALLFQTLEKLHPILPMVERRTPTPAFPLLLKAGCPSAVKCCRSRFGRFFLKYEKHFRNISGSNIGNFCVFRVFCGEKSSNARKNYLAIFFSFHSWMAQ